MRDQGPITEGYVACFDDLPYVPPNKTLIPNISFSNDRIRNILTGKEPMMKARAMGSVCHTPHELFQLRFGIGIYRMTSSADDRATKGILGYISCKSSMATKQTGKIGEPSDKIVLRRLCHCRVVG